MLLAAFTLSQILSYPFPSAPVRDAKGTAIAYTIDRQGVRSIWFARGVEPQRHAPDWPPRQIFSSGSDDGQELSDLVISNDDAHVVYVRGGDHDENWPVPLQPNPASSTVQPEMRVWSVSTAGGAPKLLGEGDAPAISPDGGRVAFVDAAGAVQIAPVDGSVAAKRLFFDRGVDSELHWSPDGSALAFVSTRTDHSFIAIYRNDATPLAFLAPSTSQDFMPRWSPDGREIAFIRLPGDGGPPRNPLNWNPVPWQIWVGDVQQATARNVWSSGNAPRDSLPQSGLGPFLEWIGGDRLIFNSERDNWPHLYSVSASTDWCGHDIRTGQLLSFVVSAPPCRQPRLLTPSNYMVENVSVAPDLRSVVFSANSGPSPDDRQRRRLFRVDLDGGRVIPLTLGNNVTEFEPVALADDAVAFDTDSGFPPLVAVQAHGAASVLDDDLVPRDFPDSYLVVPRSVTFKAQDGTPIDGQLFLPSGAGRHPGIIFVHGGPFRQMLLGWHYMDYYSNAYAVNQYLASRGFVVLSVNYRCGIGYGHDFNFPARWGPTGASEYQDVIAGARFLQRDPHVDAKRIGIWGGSYGGYLTALALARNSDIFKAGVDFHGVHDWALDIDNFIWGLAPQLKRYQQFDTRAMMKLAWESSPDSAIATWKSPVLLIQGDDDRNVEFHQMVDLAQRLRLAGVRFDEIVIPNEIHGFLRYASWLQADAATVEYFSRQLKR